jgi:hypothetical protein
MLDYQIQPNTRRCSASGRELRPGERYFSMLLDEDGKFVRRDYSAEAWQGPPAGAFSFWVGRIPTGDAKKRPPIDDDLLLDCFTRLEGDAEPRRVHFRFVLALLLMRRKRLKLDGSATEAGQEVLLMRCTRSGATHHVVNPQLTDEQIAEVQEEVFQALGWDG